MSSISSILMSILFIILLVFGITRIYLIAYSNKEENPNKSFIGYLLALAVCLIICSFIFLTHFNYDFSKTITSENFGDHFGGILGPFIAIAAVIVTGLAFWMQYQANQLVLKQFSVQQFESQFFEMLRLHKENVNEMKIKVDNEEYVGRQVFKEMRTEFHNLLKLATKDYKLDSDVFLECYNVYFFGYTSLEELKYIKSSDLYSLVPVEGGSAISWHHIGHSALLGHYYRHLFQLVKYVANDKKLTEKAKKKYLKLVRAQLSNYEQIMLFYNWLADGYGDAWEQDINSNLYNQKTNYFFTRYRMIHNLWHDELYQDQHIFKFVKGLIEKYEKVKFDNSRLFENNPKFLNSYEN